MANLSNMFQDFVYLYTLAVVSWATVLSGWTVAQERKLTIGVFTDQWFMLIIVALVMIVTFAYRWSKETLP